MLDTKLEKTGTLLIHDGQVFIEGFDADDCMCREVAIHAMLWAIGKLQEEVRLTIHDPELGNACMDLPAGVGEALGLPDPWEE